MQADLEAFPPSPGREEGYLAWRAGPEAEALERARGGTPILRDPDAELRAQQVP